MATRSTSLVPFPITSMPDRLTPLGVFDKTITTSATLGSASASAFKRLNRVNSANFTFAVPVTEVTEMGSQFRVGGIDELGEVKFKLDLSSVGINNLANLCGINVSQAAGASTTVGLTQFQNASIDLFRFMSDPQNNVFGTIYMQDCIIEDYTVDIKTKSLVMENLSGKGPNAVSFAGFILPKVYKASAADNAAGYMAIGNGAGSVFSASENLVPLPLPSNGSPLSFWQQNGAFNFLKIEKVTGAVPTRYKEVVVGNVQTAVAIGNSNYITPSTFLPALAVNGSVTLGLGTANVETATVTAIASQVSTTSTAPATAGASVVITPASMIGIYPGVTLQLANADGTSAETQAVASVTSTTFTVATLSTNKTANFVISSKAPSFLCSATKTHAIGDPINVALTPSQNYVGSAAFIGTPATPSTYKLYIGDTINTNDCFRLVFCSYATDASANNVPVTIPQNSPDTADRAGVSTRIVPVTIGAGSGAGQINRLQSVSFNFSFKRDDVNGVGETAKVYGVPSVPDVKISFDVKETDLSLPSQLLTGSKNLSTQGGSIANDFVPFELITRTNLGTPTPITAKMYDPFNPTVVLATYSCPQMVVTGIDYSSSSKADNTVKITAMDITGNFTVTYTAPA